MIGSSVRLTLRSVIILPFVILFILAMGIIGYVQSLNYEAMIQDISSKQLKALAANVNLELKDFLSQPYEASLAMSHSIGFNQLYRSGDTRQIERYFRSSFLELYPQLPQLDVIGFGGIGGEYVGFRKEHDGDLTLMLQDDRTRNRLVIFRNDSEDSEPLSIIDNYDPRTRPWYQPVAEQYKPMWSSIYANVDERQEITLSALTPMFDKQAFSGVVVTDIKIDTFNHFLRRLKQRSNALIHVFDRKNRLVAHSSTSSIVSWGTELTDQGERLLTTESANPVIKAGAEYLQNQQLPLDDLPLHFNYYFDGERYFAYLTEFSDPFGLNWYIGVTLSESDLVGKVRESQHSSWIIGLGVSGLAILLGWFAINRITTPIRATASAARNLANGDWNSTLPKTGHISELNILVRAFNEMTNNLQTSFKAMRSQLLYDSVTKLYSREGLIEQCNKLGRLEGHLIVVGINKFRDINDSLGYDRGDQLLTLVADQLKSLSGPDAMLARIGGNEFAIYMPKPLAAEQITLFANQIMQVFASPFSIHGDSVVVNVSIGLVQEETHDNMTLWLRDGSIALSNAKQKISRISRYRPEMADVSRQRTQMQARIKDALEQQQFVPFYQPIVDLTTGEITGAEALARWLSTDQGLIPPLEFIPIAEERGLIGNIGEQILRQACQDAVAAIAIGKWQKEFELHVNLSVNQLMTPDFTDSLQSILEETTLPARNLTLEITESRLVDNDDVIIRNMQAIRDLGVKIAIDDFGTGYSSLAYLHRLPFDCLKIDKTFVDKLNRQDLHQSIVAAIIQVTRSMDINLVAEGIENQDQAEMLTELGCPNGQGFLYGRPMPFEQWPTNLVNMN
ncbi:EAL domain-containing protein [Vibrio sp.]|uniref:bifunctional diguanylate cyclase/phosphodiesterase n=1 Tax=Vibrio sp. TaxID=678 RepID=UPI003D13EAAB